MDLQSLSDHVAHAFKVEQADFYRPTRGNKNLAAARQSLIYLYSKFFPKQSYTSLGLIFKRDRTTIRHAIEKMVSDPPPQLVALEQQLVSTTPTVQTGIDLEGPKP